MGLIATQAPFFAFRVVVIAGVVLIASTTDLKVHSEPKVPVIAFLGFFQFNKRDVADEMFVID